MLRRTGRLSLLNTLKTLESPGERTKAQAAPEQRSAGPKTGADLWHSPRASPLWSPVCLRSPSSPSARKSSISVARSSQLGNYRPVFPFVTLRSLSFPLNKHVRKGRSCTGAIFTVLPQPRFKSPVSYAAPVSVSLPKPSCLPASIYTTIRHPGRRTVRGRAAAALCQMAAPALW